jgi:hypothetical protein
MIATDSTKTAPTWGLVAGKGSEPIALWQSYVILAPLSCQNQDMFEAFHMWIERSAMPISEVAARSAISSIRLSF